MDEQSPIRTDPFWPDDQIPIEAGEPPPWGFWLTLVWSFAAFVAAFVVQIIVFAIFMVVRMVGRPAAEFDGMVEKLASDGLLVAIATIASCLVLIGFFALASRVRGHRVRGYLALKPLKRGETIAALASLAVFIVMADGFTWLSGQEVVPQFMIDAYQTAVFLPLLIAALVVAAPLSEEIAFRGFIYRGLSNSWLGAWGAVLMTSLCWAVLHFQYGLYHIGLIFISGLLLGYWRWKTGSTSLTILMHAVMNVVATIETAIAVEVLGAGAA